MEVDNGVGVPTEDSASGSACASPSSVPAAASATLPIPKVGSHVKIHGLVNASQHNGKIGIVVKGAATTPGETKNSQQRLGVKLQDGSNKVLAVKLDNLEVVVGVKESPAGKDTAAAAAAAAAAKSTNNSTSSSSSTTEPKNQRELKRQTGLLEEFDGSFEYDRNTLVLYYHLRDRAFDCFNSKEYQTQFLNYLNHGMTVRLVLPRKIHQHKYWLVGLQYVDDPSRNVLCDVAFQAGRSFTGISMLVKHKCFHCGNPLPTQVELCRGCSCACFCQSCLTSKPQTVLEHQQLVCDRVDKSKIIMETECIQLLE